MPQQFVFNAEEMSGNTNVTPFQAPIAPVDNKVASSLANVGKQLVTDVQGQALQQDLQEESAAFIAAKNEAADQIATLNTIERVQSLDSDFDADTAHERALIAEAEVATKKLETAMVQGRLTGAAFRAKTEAVMKGYINRHPGLTQEFRKVASDTLGFDPNGAALKNAMDAADYVDKNDSAIKLALGKQLIAGWVYDKSKSLDANIAEGLVDFQSAKLAEQQQDLLHKQEGQSLESRARTQRQVINSTAQGRYVATTKIAAKNLGGPLTDEYLASLDQNAKLTITASLRRQKAELRNSLMFNYEAMSEGDRESAAFASIEHIDNQIAWVNGELPTQMLTSSNEAAIARAKGKILSNPDNATFFAIVDAFGKQPLSGAAQRYSDTMTSNLLQALADGADQRKLEDLLKKEGVDSPQAKKIIEEQLTSVTEGFNNLSRDGEITDEQAQAFVKHLSSIAAPVWEQDENALQLESMDSLFKAASHESFDKVMKYLKGDTRLYNSIIRASGKYTTKVFNGINHELNSVAGDKGWYQLNGNKDGKVWFELGKPALDWYAKRADSTDTKGIRDHRENSDRKIMELNNKFAWRLNNITQALARIGGRKDILNVAATQLSTRLDQVPFTPQFQKMFVDSQAVE
jgi:hypothetical protein